MLYDGIYKIIKLLLFSKERIKIRTMNKDQIKEKLANLRLVQTHTWIAMLAAFSGSFGLAWGFKGVLVKIISFAGVLFSFFLLYVYLNRNELINKITKNMED